MNIHAAEITQLAATGLVNTQSHPTSTYLEVVRHWEALPDGLRRRPSMAERTAIAGATATPHVNGVSTSFVTRVIEKVCRSEPLGARPRGGGNNIIITDDVAAYIYALWEQNVELEAWEYQHALAAAGLAVSETAIKICLRDTLGLVLKKPSIKRIDKYSDDNIITAMNYMDT
eukprot:g3402.t1